MNLRSYWTYEIIPELNLIVEFSCGKFYLKDLAQIKQQQFLEKNYNPNYNYLTILSYCDIIYTTDDIIDYSSELTKYNELIGKRKSAILTDTPSQVALSVLYSRQLKEFPISYNIFSTLEAALKWVNLPTNKRQVISNMIEKWLKKAT